MGAFADKVAAKKAADSAKPKVGSVKKIVTKATTNANECGNFGTTQADPERGECGICREEAVEYYEKCMAEKAKKEAVMAKDKAAVKAAAKKGKEAPVKAATKAPAKAAVKTAAPAKAAGSNPFRDGSARFVAFDLLKGGKAEDKVIEAIMKQFSMGKKNAAGKVKVAKAQM